MGTALAVRLLHRAILAAGTRVVFFVLQELILMGFGYINIKKCDDKVFHLHGALEETLKSDVEIIFISIKYCMFCNYPDF